MCVYTHDTILFSTEETHKQICYGIFIEILHYGFVSSTSDVFDKPKFIWRVSTDVVTLRKAGIFH